MHSPVVFVVATPPEAGLVATEWRAVVDESIKVDVEDTLHTPD
jgi:hypothetical protein